jgi:hypothetical protein
VTRAGRWVPGVQVAAMPRGELAALWQQYLHVFAALLLRMHGDTQSSSAHRLVRSYGW